jgi:hypothetical protein
LDVGDLLALVLLDDDLVDQSGGLNIADPLGKALAHIQFAASVVVLLRSHADDQVVPERLRSFQQPSVPLMEQIEGAVSDYPQDLDPLGVWGPIDDSGV